MLLVAIASTGLLLATNFSFVGLYEKIVQLIGNRFAVVHSLPARFAAWRAARSEQTRLRKEKQAALKAEAEAARAAMRDVRDLSPAERVAEFMKGRSRCNLLRYYAVKLFPPPRRQLPELPSRPV